MRHQYKRLFLNYREIINRNKNKIINYKSRSCAFLYIVYMKHIVLFVIMMLVVLTCCTSHEKYEAMRYGLDSINQRNRCDLPFTVQDVEPYVEFFDHHGTANDCMLAHYLLGRAYYESHEAPMALQCYHEAIECADTTDENCDYKQLCRVYAQMAQIFYEQELYKKQLIYEEESEKYAWKGKDTLAALMSYEQKSFAYAKLGKLDSAGIVRENVASKYEEYGYTDYAAIVLSYSLSELIESKEFSKAKQYMDIYESKSGLFDSYRNITNGHEIYYKILGYYYIGIGKIDSAEYYFRKELRDGRYFDNQHAGAKGLAELYQNSHQPDSAAKYYQYTCNMLDSMYAKKTAKEIERMQSMYDYTRHQKEAFIEKEKATQANRQLLVCLVILLAISLIASWLHIARKQVIESLKQTSLELASAREELVTLQQNCSYDQQTIVEKETRIKHLEHKLGKYGKLVYFGSEKVENDLLLSANYQKIKSMAYKGQVLLESDWKIIQQLICEYFPGFNDFLLSKLKIESIEYKVSMLLRLHLKAGEIANMLCVTPPYISKVSTTILANIFNKRGSSKDLTKEFSKII